MFGFGNKKSVAVIEAPPARVLSLQEQRVQNAEKRLAAANDAMREYQRTNSIFVNGMMAISTARSSRVALETECEAARLEFSRALSEFSAVTAGKR